MAGRATRPTAGSRSTRRGGSRRSDRGRPTTRPSDGAAAPLVDLRPLVVMPGMVDLHVHLPQLPNAGVGAGLDLLTWLERYIFPLERAFDEAAAERLAPLAFRAFAAAGTTTAVLYGAVFQPSLDAAFRAAEAHGIRAVIGKVMMDRGSYDDTLTSARVLDASLRQSADLCARWHMRDDGRLRYAVTPRFAISLRAGHAAPVGRPRPRDRRLLADARRGGPQRDPRGRAAVPRRHRLPRRLRPGRRPRPRGDPRPRDPPLAAGDRPRRGDGRGDRPLPRLEPVPRLGRDAARALPGGRDPRRAGLGRLGGAGALDLRQHARRGVHPERAAGPRRRSVASRATTRRRCSRSTGCGSRPTTARGRSGSRTRSGRSRPARRPT